MADELPRRIELAHRTGRELGRLEAFRECARWLVEATNYPFDFSTSLVPPLEMRRCIEDVWVDKDGDDSGETEEAIRANVRDEGGWPA